jgi:hypothetical protein
MLVITVDLIPGGCERCRRTIGSMRIANLSNLADTSEYSVEVVEAANHLTGAPSWNGKCVVLAHDAVRACGPLWRGLARELSRRTSSITNPTTRVDETPRVKAGINEIEWLENAAVNIDRVAAI